MLVKIRVRKKKPGKRIPDKRSKEANKMKQSKETERKQLFRRFRKSLNEQME